MPLKQIDGASFTSTDILDALRCERGSCPCHKSARDGRGMTHCATHDDADPSLSVAPPNRTPNPLVHCYAGCSYDAITNALRARGLWPNRTEYRIGASVHYREDTPGGKRVAWAQGAKPRELLYPDGALDGLPSGVTVVVVEGEKACDAGIARGLNVVATVCGAASIPTRETLANLRHYDVVLCPDNDDAGRRHMAGVAKVLGSQARWLELPGLPEKGDLADYTGTDADLATLITDAGKWVAKPESAPALLCQSSRVDWASFWAAGPKAEEWLIEPILPRGRQVAIYSPAKQGKSLLSLDVAARAATGKRVLDRPAGEPLNVVYFDLEMTEGDLYERLEDMGYGMESDLSHLHYYLLPSLPPLDTAEGGQAVLAIVRHHDADLVVIDTTSRVLEGPENDADTLRAFYLNTGLPLKADGRTLWRNDHAGKDLGKGQRGTSAKNDDVDLVWELTAQDDGIRLRATHRRQSWVPEVVPLLRLSDPLRHERAAHTWPAGTVELAQILDDLAVPRAYGARRVRTVLREDGNKVRNELIAAAIRYRKNEAETCPQVVGTPSASGTGTPDGDTLQRRFGDTYADTWGHPAGDTGDQGVPLTGDTCPVPTLTPVAANDESCTHCAAPLVAYSDDGEPLCEVHSQPPTADGTSQPCRCSEMPAGQRCRGCAALAVAR